MNMSLQKRQVPGLKLQAPNTKLQGSSKSQTPDPKLQNWHLEIDACLKFGVWDLEFRPQPHKRKYA
jgi:hypothetical protein